jgi:hypothetical protein
LCLALSAGALAQSTNYTSIEAVPGKPSQINYHASAGKDCTPAPRPAIRVVEPPKYGVMTVRPATLTTNQVSRCPNLKTDADVVLYSARTGFSGSDHLVYELTNANGSVDTFDVKITVKPASPPAGQQL